MVFKMRTFVAAISLIMVACGAPLHRVSMSDIPGIHSPLPIDPIVEISDDGFLLDLYSLAHSLPRCANSPAPSPLSPPPSPHPTTAPSHAPRYHLLLNRDHDAQGFAVNLAALRASGRASVYTAFVSSAEFQGNAALKDRASFVSRVYLQLLHRAPSSSEVAQVLQASPAFVAPTRTPARLFIQVHAVE
jgi:hypothetical protein